MQINKVPIIFGYAEFRSLSEFYLIIFLNKLQIVDPPPLKEDENHNETSIAKAIGPSEVNSPLLGSPDPRPMYRLNPLSKGLYILHK
jgi:hypothetical protein